MYPIKLSDFDRIVCMCLDKRRNEWAQLEQQFSQRGARIERFIVGKGKILPREMYNQIDPEQPIESWPATSMENAYYCYMAHRAIIEKAQKDGLKNILLLEDDCQLMENFDEILERANKQIKDLGLKWDTLTFGQNIKWARATQLSPNVLKLNEGAYCWHAIAINQEHNDMFQQFLDLPADGPFDWMWAHRIQPKFQCLGIWPTIAIQKPGYSFVNQRMEDYTNWLEEKGNNYIV